MAPVCRFCHREKSEHPLSRTGYKQCAYTEHRPDCPGPPVMPTVCLLDDDMSDNGEDIIATTSPPELSTTTSSAPTTTFATSQAGLAYAMSNLSINTPRMSILTSFFTPSSVSLSSSSMSNLQQHLYGSSSVGNNSQQQNLSLLASQHVAQQQLQQQRSLPPYSGPSMSNLRDVHGSSADQIMNLIRDNIPALGSAPSVTTSQPQQPGPSRHIQQELFNSVGGPAVFQQQGL